MSCYPLCFSFPTVFNISCNYSLWLYWLYCAVAIEIKEAQLQSNADRMIRTDMLFDTVQASRNLDNSSEKKMWFSISLDIIFGTEAAKLSPIENLIGKLRKWEERKIYTHTEKEVNLLKV